MKNVLLTICLLLMLSACGGGRGKITIKGQFKNLQDGEFYVFSTDPSWGSFDTIHVTDGEFRFTHSLEDTSLLTVQYPNFMQMQVVAIPGKTITIKGDANNLLTTRISGCKENELLTDFRRSVLKMPDSEIMRKAENFIRKQPANYASQAIFEQYFVNIKNMDYDKTQSLLKLLIKNAPERVVLKTLNLRLEPLALCCKGKKLPSFSAVTMRGQKVDNKTLHGKWALICFWSTWGSDMIGFAQQERKLLRPYMSKMQVVNISLDADTIEVMGHIKSDSIIGFNICDRQSWQSPLVHTFGVRYLPSVILVNPQGVVVGRDMEDANLQSELKKIL